MISIMDAPPSLAPFDPPMRETAPHQGGRVGPVWPWWLAIIALCAVIMLGHSVERFATGPTPAAPDHAEGMLKFAARYAMGVRELSRLTGAPASAQQTELLESIDTMSATVVDRVRASIIAGELAGRDAALSRLTEVEAELESAKVWPEGDVAAELAAASDGGTWIETPAELEALKHDAALLRTIYEGDLSSAALTPAQVNDLRNRHAWFAQVALAYNAPPANPERRQLAREAMRVLIAAMVMGSLVLGAGAAGFVLFIVAAVKAGATGLRARFLPSLRSFGAPSALELRSWESTGIPTTVFIATFALFLFAFIAVALGAAGVEAFTGIDISAFIIWPTALIALWPLTQGVAWAQLRAALGWHANGAGMTGILREMGFGIIGYLAGMPILFAGILLTLIITLLTQTDASHPIAQEIDFASVWSIVGIYFLAAVWAPLVEETFFRGSLYFHLRRRWAAPGAALLTGFIFAAIHPQGLAGIPVLTAMGMNFCLIREWRGSLIGPMTAHALNNGVIVTMLVVVMG